MITLLWTFGLTFFCFFFVLPIWMYFHSKWNKITNLPFKYLDYWWNRFHPEDKVDNTRYE